MLKAFKFGTLFIFSYIQRQHKNSNLISDTEYIIIYIFHHFVKF
jgi:hypothetical protein